METGLSKSKIRSWSHQFREGELTVEDVQERFAGFTEADLANLPSGARRTLTQVRQELDAIRYGMCESGQRGEVQRMFRELEAAFLSDEPAGH